MVSKLTLFTCLILLYGFFILYLNYYHLDMPSKVIYDFDIDKCQTRNRTRISLDEIRECLESPSVLSGVMFPSDCLLDDKVVAPNPFSVSPSMYDRYLKTKRKFNVIFLYDWRHIETIMDRSFFNLFYAVCDHPKVELCEMWGKGWEGWDNNIGREHGSGGNVAANIKKRYPDVRIDVLMTEPDRGHPIPDVSLGVAPINSLLVHETYCQTGFADCNSKDLINWANVIFFAYANTQSQIHHWLTDSSLSISSDSYSPKLFYHYPHSINRDIFYRPAQEPRNISILLVGKINNLYPLRVKIEEMINAGKIPHASLRVHPGYHDLGTPNNDQGYDYHGASKFQEKAYAEDLKHAKIVIVSRSIRHYSLRKYQEVMMSGALVMGNFPAERDGELRQYMVEINTQDGFITKKTEDSEESIIQKCAWWLEHEEERVYLAGIGQKYAEARYSTVQQADSLVNAWDGYLDGVRGSWYPFQHGITGKIYVNRKAGVNYPDPDKAG